MNFSKFKLSQIFTNSTADFTVDRPKLNSVRIPKIFSKLPTVNFNKISPKSLVLTLVGIGVVAAAILIILSQFGRSATFQQNVTAEVPIGKSFKFPVYGANGKAADISLIMNLTSAAKMKNILIQGKPATAREGKAFLIINLEITNDYQQKLKIAPVDLIRLVDSSGKKFAPDVHNETIIAEPISVKKTRVGFVVDEPSSGLQLQVGEINGPKETISLAI